MDTVQGGRTIYGGGEGADTKQDKTRHYTGGNEHYTREGMDTTQCGDGHYTRWTDNTQKWGTIHDGRDGHYSMGTDTTQWVMDNIKGGAATMTCGYRHYTGCRI